MSGLDIALAWRARGRRVMPCWNMPGEQGHKAPMTKRGVLDASDDEGQIREWFGRNPDALVGLAGGNGLLFVDLDGKSPDRGDGIAAWKAFGGSIEGDHVVTTPSDGKHLYFSGDDLPNSKDTIAGGLEVRCKNQYVIAWKVCEAWPVPPVPEFLLARIADSKKVSAARRVKSVLSTRYDLVKAFKAASDDDYDSWYLGEVGRQGKHAVVCPFHKDHDASREYKIDATVIFEPNGDGEPWGFKCSRSSCDGKRHVRDVIKLLKPKHPEFFPDPAPSMPGGMSLPEDPRIAVLNDRFAIADIGSDRRDTFVVEFDKDGGIECLREIAAFKRHLMAEAPVKFYNADKQRIDSRALAVEWLLHPNARRYNKLVFAPVGSKTSVGPNDYNTWRGLSTGPAAGDWSLTRTFIRDIICAGNEEHEKWLHNWLAALVQQPGRHAMTAILLKGGQGIGKGTFADGVVGKLFRPANYKHLMDPERLTGRFNSHLSDCVLVFADESFWGDAKAANKLKGLITEDTIDIERKLCPVETQESSLHIIIASNHDRPVKVERDDRRYFVLQVSEQRKQDAGYFRAVLREQHHGGREAILDYLLNYKVEWGALVNAKETRARQDMKAASMGPVEEWWQNVLDEATESSWAQWQDRVPKPFVANSYLNWVEEYDRYGKRLNTDQLGKWLKRLFDVGGHESWPQEGGRMSAAVDRARPRSWRFPELAVCRKVFDRATGTDHEWSSDDHDESDQPPNDQPSEAGQAG